MAYRTEIEKLEQRYAENPKQWFAALADAYRKQGDVDLAIEYVTGGIEDRPDYASAHIVLGRCYLDKNMDEDAANAFEQVLELDAENIVALKSLEEIAERKGDNAGARQWLTRLLEVDPMNEAAHENLARLEAEEKANAPSPEAEGLAPEVPIEEDAVDVEESDSSEMKDEPPPPPITLSEDVVDASSVEFEPMVLDASMPMDGDFDVEQEDIAAAIEPIQFETADTAAEIEPIQIETVDTAAEIEPIEIEMEETTAEIEPIQIETADSDASSWFAEGSGAAAIEPFEVETEDSDAISQLSAAAGDAESGIDDGAAASSFGSIELDTPGGDANFSLADLQGRSEFQDEADDEPVAELEPLELETPAEDANSLLASFSEEAESPAALDETVSEVGAIEFDPPDASARATFAEELEPPEELEELEELDEFEEPDEPDKREGSEDIVALEETVDEAESAEESAQRLSVPPTKEVDAVDLEAMRSVDEMIARPTLDSAVVVDDGVDEPVDTFADTDDFAEAAAEIVSEDEELAEDPVEEGPRTREIDAVELEKLRVADALVVGSTVEAMTPDSVDDDDQAEEEAAEPEPLVESRWDVEDVTDVQDAEEPADETEDADQEFDEEPKSIYDSDTDADVLPLIMPEEAGEGETDLDAEPEPLVTETMAEVYAKQGLYEQAREIYEVLVMQHADDSRLKARLDELNQQASSAIQETRQSRFSVGVTGGESTVGYLQRIFSYEGDVVAAAPSAGVATAEPETLTDSESEMAPTPLEQAFGDEPPEVPGEPTVVAANDVSLASVFDGDASEPTATEDTGEKLDQAPDESEGEDGVSFDEFYGSEPRQSLPDANGSPSDEEPSDDDDNFKDWLKGLKT